MYVCLGCGSETGDIDDDGDEAWYWKRLRNGRIGPFCRPDSCLSKLLEEISDSNGPLFTQQEWKRLMFVRNQNAGRLEMERTHVHQA